MTHHKSGADYRSGDTFTAGYGTVSGVPLGSALHPKGEQASLAITPNQILSEWQPSEQSLQPDDPFVDSRSLFPRGGARASFDVTSPDQPTPPPSLPDIGTPYTGGTWGAPGVRYNVTFNGFTATPPSGEAGPGGGIVEGPFTVQGIGTLALRVVGANGTQTDALLSTFNSWVAIKFISITIVP